MASPSLRVFVAGATGYLGGFLVHALLRQGHQVLALSRTAQRAEALRDAGAQIVIAQATDPASLRGTLQGVDVVISALGITRQRDGLTYDQVDYQANLHLLHEAERAGVSQFTYVSVFRGPELAHTAMVGAKERFVTALKASPLASFVVRPTGFFSDMEAFLDMARSGSVWVFGDGSQRLNPISGHDLAHAIVTHTLPGQTGHHELSIGGPQPLTMAQIGELAAQAAQRPLRLRSLPLWMVSLLLWLLPKVTPLTVYGPAEMFLTASRLPMVAPAFGSDTLAAHFHAVEAQRAQDR